MDSKHGQEINKHFKALDLELNEAIMHGPDGVDREMFSVAWESLGSWRPTIITWSVRKLSRLVGDAPADKHTFLTNYVDFLFCMIGARDIAMASDIMMMSITKNDDIQLAKEILEIGRGSPYKTEKKIEALRLGMSGMHYYSPLKLIYS